ncbi:Chitinase / Hevein / PR-4 / Wheatwin2 [Medicago truncatula]|uniref:Chitinase / Hevein / PR-4 / Wheatwin2 n=1 Tax=Medicago truncatula TaxID=3880 RepID=A0A072UMD3_MEDTR|nr:Chitinase / Hevein / PR-4 / Wheatwin2 [Medicago truncatula]
MSMQLFLLDKVLIFCVLALASAQSANNVKATYQSYNPHKIKWNLNTSGVFCAAQDGNKSLSWRSEFGWAAFCGHAVGKGVCGKCLNVTNKENGIIVSKIVRIVDTCTNGGLKLDIDVFQKLDSFGTGNAQGYLMVDYEFVDCDCNTKGGNCGYISTETRRQAIPRNGIITTLSYLFLFILRAILRKKIKCMLALKLLGQYLR